MLYTRLTRRLRALRLSRFSDYIALLRSDVGGEREVFINTVTTNLTYFFREEHHFDYLQAKVLPVLQQKDSLTPLRIWSAGCSSGEEPYSIAIALSESDVPRSRTYRLLCTDLNTEMVSQAMNGLYRQEGARGLSSCLLYTSPSPRD